MNFEANILKKILNIFFWVFSKFYQNLMENISFEKEKKKTAKNCEKK